jgi:hypothetical protein
VGTRAVLRGNTIVCDAPDAPDVPPDAGCSADLTGYGDFAPVRDNVIDGNLFKAAPGGTCAFGGATAGKPDGDAARNIRFSDNVFERGRRGRCGYWSAIMDLDRRTPRNVWRGNVWQGGGTVRP